MSRKNQHVIPHSEGWAVKGAGNGKATAVYATQKEAVARAQEIAKNQLQIPKFMEWTAGFERVTATEMILVRRATKNRVKVFDYRNLMVVG